MLIVLHVAIMWLSAALIYVHNYVGLTDKVLESVVAKGSGELLSLDLSAVPHLLTDHALSVIGQYVAMAKCNVTSQAYKHAYHVYVYSYNCVSRLY